MVSTSSKAGGPGRTSNWMSVGIEVSRKEPGCMELSRLWPQVTFNRP